MAKFDPKNKTWKSAESPYPFPMNTFLGDEILKKLKETPDRICQIFHEDGYELSCDELRVKSIRVAQNLTKLGIKSNDVVTVICRPSHELTFLIYGSIYIGAPINPLDLSFSKDDLKQMFSQTYPKLVVCDSDMKIKVQKALSELKMNSPIYSMNCGDENEKTNFSELLIPTGNEENFIAPKFKEKADEKVFAIVFSSGSTGSPKGFEFSHAQVFLDLSYYARLEVTALYFTFCPIFWTPGLMAQVEIAFKRNGTLIISRECFSLEKFKEIVEMRRPTDFDEAPMNVNLILQSDFADNVDHRSLIRFSSSGSIHSESLRKKFSKVFPEKHWEIVYGSTENGVISWTGPDEYKKKYSVGSNIFPNLIFKIIDEDDNKLGSNKTGELCIKQIYAFKGYFKNAEASKNALDEEGFYKSGDIGYFDEQGMLFIVDRKKQIVKSHTYQVNLEEIENVVESIEGVKLVSVVAIPNDDFDNVLAAVIVKEVGFEDLSGNDIVDFVSAHLPYYKHLDGGVFFVDKMPATGSGKVDKNLVLKSLHLESHSKINK